MKALGASFAFKIGIIILEKLKALNPMNLVLKTMKVGLELRTTGMHDGDSANLISIILRTDELV